MPPKFWIKLYLEILDDPKMARLPNHLWRRLVELFLLAGRQGNDGALPPVEEMAWTLRLSRDKLLEDLHGLAEVGVVHACAGPAPCAGRCTTSTGEAQPGGTSADLHPRCGHKTPAAQPGGNAPGLYPHSGHTTSAAHPGMWFVTHFKERQSSESVGRVRRYRERYRIGQCNGGEAGDPSTSTSVSGEEGVTGEGQPLVLPRSPVEALLHPDVRVFTAVTGGRIPGLSQYQLVIETVRLLRTRQQLDDDALAGWLKPYWLAWSSRKRLDGRPYDPGNITWLAEWALNGSIPPVGSLSPPGGSRAADPGRMPVPSPEETRRMLAEKDEKLKHSVPPPEAVRAKIRGLGGRLAGKDPP